VIVDADSHLYEPRTLWSDFAGPARADDALHIEDDELGWSWLTWRGERLALAQVFHPNDNAHTGRQLESMRRGEPPEIAYDEELPPDYWEPSARLVKLDEQGIDETVGFPNHGLIWERALSGDLPALTLNMRAWNRWAVTVRAESKGRIHPVGHVTMRDLDWLEEELAALAAGDVRLAMTAPSLVDGKPLSHPDLDRAWSLFVDHDVTPVFHVASFEPPIDDAWTADDPDQGNPVLHSAFLWLPAALALGDLAIHGTFEQHPDLRLGIMELSAYWYGRFLLELDGAFDFHATFNGRPFRELERKPSEAIRDHVRIAAFSYERPDVLTNKVGDVFMFCSDYPDGEGTATPVQDYARVCGSGGTPDAAPGLFADNVRWLLRTEGAPA
jgi:hypothetical protein